MASVASMGRWLRIRPRSMRNPKTRADIGLFGEERVAEYIRRTKGMRVICRNWKSGRGEIDIIAWDGSILAFVEVRTRDAEARVPGYYSVSRHKKRILRRTCQRYLRSLRPPPERYRFDIAEVRYRGPQDYRINHYENVPLFAR